MKSSVSARFNAELLEQNYDQWCQDPQSVDSDWAMFFEGFELGVAQIKQRSEAQATPAPSARITTVDDLDDEFLNFRGKVVGMVYAYRALGHTQAHLNPLDSAGDENPDLFLSELGLHNEDFARKVSTCFFRDSEKMTLGELHTLCLASAVTSTRE